MFYNSDWQTEMACGENQNYGWQCELGKCNSRNHKMTNLIPLFNETHNSNQRKVAPVYFLFAGSDPIGYLDTTSGNKVTGFLAILLKMCLQGSGLTRYPQAELYFPLCFQSYVCEII